MKWARQRVGADATRGGEAMERVSRTEFWSEVLHLMRAWLWASVRVTVLWWATVMAPIMAAYIAVNVFIFEYELDLSAVNCRLLLSLLVIFYCGVGLGMTYAPAELTKRPPPPGGDEG